MTINIKPRHFIIFGLVITLGISGYLFRDKISGLFISGSQATVDKALNYFKNQKSDDKDGGLSLFSTDFTIDLLMYHSYYKIEEWKLKVKDEKDGKSFVQVDGSATNAFGAKLQRQPIFVVEKKDGQWRITDSYDFFVFDKIKDIYALGKSDREKHKMMEDVKDNVKIEEWSFSSSYGESIKGKATIVNNSDLPVSFVKLEITYYDNSGNVTNTDETYAIGGDQLRPGQRRNIDWYTSNCYRCKKASVRLKFDD